MLRSVPVESALEICGFNFAASQSHRLENLLESECGILITPFSRKMVLVCLFLDRLFYTFGHKIHSLRAISIP